MEREIEICHCKDIVDIPSISLKRRTPSITSAIKAAALKVSPSVVGVITYNVPDGMIYRSYIEGAILTPFVITREYKCPATGIIIQCEEDARDATYISTIICPAIIFKRTNSLQPHDIKVDVCVAGGTLYKGCLLDCDFSYNLAALTIKSKSPLQPATFRHLTHVTSIKERPSQLRPHSHLNSFKVSRGTKIMTTERSWADPYEISVMTGVFSSHGVGYKELFAIKGSKPKRFRGGAVITNKGEVIGICFSNGSFLPYNLVSRWWDHYKSCGQFLRPYVGVELANRRRGVVVTKVEENSPAHKLGIELDDVIIGYDGYSIGSKLEFFERVWENAGRVVKLNVLKAGDGNQLKKLDMTIGDTLPDKLYEWGIPECW